MTAAAFPENYCICVGDDGAPRELWRSGTAVTYKAMGYQSGRAVALQLIPLASVTENGRAQFERKVRVLRNLKHPNIARAFDVREEDEHLVFATEFLQGETAERWVVTHGPMPPDAVLRIGLQVVSALTEAAFHSLSHRAIQPSNLMIVTGAAPDGDWPFVKLLHFGLAGLKLYSDGKEVVPAIGPAFASPEQLDKGKVDFRSEIFSLGATMCFLLTGDVPLAGRARKSGPGERKLPVDVPVARPVRHLLRRMLRVDPDDRPHDSLLFADELRACLKKVERRRAFRGAPSMPLDLEPERKPTFDVEVRGADTEDRPYLLASILTGLTMLLLLGAFGMILLPTQMQWWTQRHRPIESIGVQVGVDESAPVKEKVELASPAPITEGSSVFTPTQQEKTEPVVAEQSASPNPPPPATSSTTPEQTSSAAIAEKSSVSQTTTSDANSSTNPSPSPAVENSPVVTHEAETQVQAVPPVASATPTPEQMPAIAENPQASQPAASDVDSSTMPASSPALEKSPAATPEVEAQVPAAAPSATPGENNPAPPGEGPSIAASTPPSQIAVEKPIQHEPPAASEQKSESSAAGRTAITQKPAKNASSRRRGKADVSERKVRKVKPPLHALPVVDDRPPVVVLPPED